MKSIFAIIAIFTFSINAAEEFRICEKKKPFPPHSEMSDLSKGDYDYEKHIYELSYDEVKDVSFQKLSLALVYFEKTLPQQIEKYGNLFNTAELGGTYFYHEQTIQAYILRQRALIEYLQTGKKGELSKQFCDYLSTLAYHP